MVTKCDKGRGWSKIGGRKVTYFLNSPLAPFSNIISFVSFAHYLHFTGVGVYFWSIKVYFEMIFRMSENCEI